MTPFFVSATKASALKNTVSASPLGSYVTIGASVMAAIIARSTRTKSGTRAEK